MENHHFIAGKTSTISMVIFQFANRQSLPFRVKLQKPSDHRSTHRAGRFLLVVESLMHHQVWHTQCLYLLVAWNHLHLLVKSTFGSQKSAALPKIDDESPFSSKNGWWITIFHHFPHSKILQGPFPVQKTPAPWYQHGLWVGPQRRYHILRSPWRWRKFMGGFYRWENHWENGGLMGFNGMLMGFSGILWDLYRGSKTTLQYIDIDIYIYRERERWIYLAKIDYPLVMTFTVCYWTWP